MSSSSGMASKVLQVLLLLTMAGLDGICSVRVQSHAADFTSMAIIGTGKLAPHHQGSRSGGRRRRDSQLEMYIDSMDIQTAIANRFAETQVQSSLVNDNDKDIEAQFLVYLPSTAFISNFSMVIDGVDYVGVVMEKEAAEEAYDDAKERNETAGQVSNKDPPADERNMEIFLVQINVAKKTRVDFKLSYQQLLQRQLGIFKLVISIRPDVLINSLKAETNIYEPDGIRFIDVYEPGSNTVELQHTTLNHISETIKQIVYQPSASALRNREELQGDLIIGYDTIHQSEDVGLVTIDNGYFVHYFSPSGLDPLDKNVVFVIDKSGSMSGEKMAQTKEAMVVILDQLRAGDYFQMVYFDDKIEYWKSGELYSATANNIAAAKSSIQNDLETGGSTDINAALISGCDLLKQYEGSQRLNMIVFLTDGEATSGVTMSDQIVANVVDAAAGKVVIFSLGFGFHLNFELLETLSLRTEGFATRIHPGGDAAEQLELFFLGVNTPLILEVQMQYPVEIVEAVSLTKNKFNQYFNGSELVVAGKMKSQSSAKFDVSVVGLTNTNIVYTEEIDSADSSVVPTEAQDFYPKGFTERLWAYLSIKNLLEKRLTEEDEDVNKVLYNKALDLSLKYNLVTPITSMVVVQSEKPSEDSNFNSHDNNWYSSGAAPRSKDTSIPHAVYLGDAARIVDCGLLVAWGCLMVLLNSH